MTNNVIVIGGTSGIGLEVAKYLHKNDYNVLIAGRSKIDSISDIKVKLIDVSNEDSIKSFFDTLPFNTINSIVYSAGTTTNKKSIEEFDVHEYRRVHDVNLLGAILVLKYSYGFLKRTPGKVVIINSFAARTYSQFSGFEYTISKAGLTGLVKQLSIEWARDGVLINSIFPSMVGTSMLYDNVSSEKLSNIEKQIPLGRIAKPSEIATAVEFLINDKNTYITGSGLDINGGQYLTG